MKKIILIGVLLICKLSVAQPFKLEGVVVDAETKQAISNALIFIDQSLTFSKTDSAGKYSLENIRQRTFELVVVFRGYETLTYRTTPIKEQTSVRFELVKSSVSEPEFDQKSLNKWSIPFLVNLLGTSKNAAECELINPEALRFNHNEQTDELLVSSIEPLQIINEGLGYMITVQLDSFSMKALEKKGLYIGYCFFKNLSSKRQETLDKWSQGRKEAFNGSLNHFFKAVYNNTVNQDGFETHAVRVVDEESEEWSELKKKKDFTVFSKRQVVDNGTTKKLLYLIDRNQLPVDSLKNTDPNSNICSFVYPGILQVIYKNEKEDLGYLLQQTKAPSFQHTFLVCGDKVEIQPNGKFFDQQNVVVNGYMQWEKLSELLPLEYLDN